MTMIEQILQPVIEQYECLWDDWIPKDATVAIAYADRYIYYAPKQFDIHVQIGSPLPETSIAYETIQQQRKISHTVTHAESGIDYFGIGYPITLNGQQAALIVVLPPTYKQPTTVPLKFITGRMEDEWLPIPIEKASYFESYNKKNWLYVQKEMFQISLTMNELERRLTDDFVRIHRSYIVNIHAIEKISKDMTNNLIVITKGGSSLPVSRTHASKLRKILEF